MSADQKALLKFPITNSGNTGDFRNRLNPPDPCSSMVGFALLIFPITTLTKSSLYLAAQDKVSARASL
jgi:hypothetical protein